MIYILVYLYFNYQINELNSLILVNNNNTATLWGGAICLQTNDRQRNFLPSGNLFVNSRPNNFVVAPLTRPHCVSIAFDTLVTGKSQSTLWTLHIRQNLSGRNTSKTVLHLQ